MTLPLFGDPGAAAPGEAWAARQFRGGTLRISRNQTVHRVAFLLDERGVEVPAPACHIGSFAAGRPWWRVYSPTTEPVSCGLCLSGHRGEAGRDADAPGQLMLDL